MYMSLKIVLETDTDTLMFHKKNFIKWNGFYAAKDMS